MHGKSVTPSLGAKRHLRSSRFAMTREVFDYIVVGAGSAGCIVARRLAAEGNAKVLLLEAGPPDNHWTIRMPGGLRDHYKPKSRFNWHLSTVAQPHLAGRSIYQPRGKVLGGSSSINGMVYLRGHALDYERWVQEGASGWSYAEVLPYFKRLESYEVGADAYRGGKGPVVARRQEQLGPLEEAFLEAGQQAGFPATQDVNGAQQEGFGRFDMNVERGVRASTAHAYLRGAPAELRLTVRSGVLGLRVLFEQGRAVGFEYLARSGPVQAYAEREVILSAGAFGSPQILMLSGIGPADHLREHGIEVEADLPGVGANLHDHLEIHVQHRSKQPVALNRYLRPHRMLAAGVEWFLFKSGVAARNQANVGAFLRSGGEAAQPDVQFHFFPVFFDGGNPTAGTHGYRLGAGTARPTSRGRLTLTSSDPGAAPLIDPNYLATEEDLEGLRTAFALARETLAQGAFAPFDDGETDPGPQVRSKDEIETYIRRAAGSAYHPCGTCRMGPEHDRDTVVDPQGRVRGIERLRIIDASIVPSIVSSNLNLPTMMIGEKLADSVLGRSPPPPAECGYRNAPTHRRPP